MVLASISCTGYVCPWLQWLTGPSVVVEQEVLRLEPALPGADLPWDPSTDSSGQPEFPAGLTHKLRLSSSRPWESISGCKQPWDVCVPWDVLWHPQVGEQPVKHKPGTATSTFVQGLRFSVKIGKWKLYNFINPALLSKTKDILFGAVSISTVNGERLPINLMFTLQCVILSTCAEIAFRWPWHFVRNRDGSWERKSSLMSA